MHKSGVNRNTSLKVAIPQGQQSLKRLGFCSQIATGGAQQSSPVVFPEKRSKKVKASSRRVEISTDPQVKPKADEHRIDIGGGDEKSDLLGSLVYSGKLLLDKRKSASGKDATEVQQPSATDVFNKKTVDAKLTSRALVWGSDMLQLDDVVSLTYNVGLRHFTVHAYPVGKSSCALSCFTKPKRSRKDFHFITPTVKEAVQWVASLQIINCLPHPLVSKKQASSELFSVPIDTPPELVFRCKSAPKMLVILNPRSGHGRSIKVSII